ncbi:MAG: DUF1559 domain-containing protein [Planctomycetales bacterium]
MPETEPIPLRLPPPKRWKPWLWWSVAAVVLIPGLCSGFLVPAVRDAREAARRTQCRGHFYGISMALSNYHDAYGSYPPAFIADEQGRPMHSWRVLILPFIDETELYRKYRFDEAWDGPHNRQLHDSIVRLYNCSSEQPKEASPYTSYVAVIGPETFWRKENLTRDSDITDPRNSTLVVVEIAHSFIHWMEPRDLEMSHMSFPVNPTTGKGISSSHKGGAHVLFADGEARLLPDTLSADAVRSLLTISGQEIHPKLKWADGN